MFLLDVKSHAELFGQLRRLKSHSSKVLTFSFRVSNFSKHFVNLYFVPENISLRAKGF